MSTDSDQVPKSDPTTEFLRLLGAQERGLMAYILSLVANWSDADDILQEVRTRLWAQFDQYDRARDFGTWARSIAHWQVLTWRKTAARRANFLDTYLIDQIAQEPLLGEGEADRRLGAMRKCLDKLDPAKRSLVDLYYSGAKSARELADELHRSFHAVRHTLQRTRLALAECIDKALADGSDS
jgi:RNA polymerase sigma-70 factor (ECF subfamily)